MATFTALGRAAGLSFSRNFGLADMVALYRQRRALTRLDAAQLRDMGLSRDEVLAEASRPAWDVPAHWRG